MYVAIVPPNPSQAEALYFTLTTKMTQTSKENGGRTMVVGAIARHTLKDLSGATQRLVLVVVVINLSEATQSHLPSDRKVTNELYGDLGSFSGSFG
jgi:hypothetical protein